MQKNASFVRRLVSAAAAAASLVALAPARGVAAEPPPRTPHSIVYRDEAVVAAGAALVWEIVVAVPRYAEWSPWIVYAHGEAVEGTSVPVGVVLNGRVLDMSYRIVKVEPGRRFCTVDEGFLAFFVPGSRCRMIEALPDGRTRLWQELQVDGVLSWFADVTFGATVRAGMRAEIEATKARAEAR
jgi:hypothetical protein